MSLNKHIDRQKQIEKEVEKINQRAYENALKSRKNIALFIDPIPDNFITNRVLESKS